MPDIHLSVFHRVMHSRLMHMNTCLCAAGNRKPQLTLSSAFTNRTHNEPRADQNYALAPRKGSHESSNSCPTHWNVGPPCTHLKGASLAACAAPNIVADRA